MASMWATFNLHLDEGHVAHQQSQGRRRALELLDQANIVVCSNVIFTLKSVLETCTRHQETRRLRRSSTTSPSRVFAPAKQGLRYAEELGARLDLWEVHARGGRMHARRLGVHWRDGARFVLSEQVEEEAAAHAVMFSTLIKGFAGSGQHKRAYPCCMRFARQSWR